MVGLRTAQHKGVQRWVVDLNRLYKDEPALYEVDFDGVGFEWIDCNDAESSTLSYLRRAKDGSTVLVVANFTPLVRENYLIGAPQAAFGANC